MLRKRCVLGFTFLCRLRAPFLMPAAITVAARQEGLSSFAVMRAATAFLFSARRNDSRLNLELVAD